METYTVAKGSFPEHEKFVNEVYLPTMRRLDKRLKSIGYFSSIAAQDVSSFGGRMILSEYGSLADMEESNEELHSNDESRNALQRLGQLIDTSSHRVSLWNAGSWEVFKNMK